jgi:uncharacterized repeat protein (TIGR03803 family)
MKSSIKNLFLLSMLAAGASLMVAGQASAQTFKLLYSFTNGSDGSNPYGGLVVSGNTIYGMTDNGGSARFGNVFAVNTNGTGFTTLYSFTNGADGAAPKSGLILAGTTLYGAAEGGGGGTVFSISTTGANFTTLYSFTNGSDGGYPNANLVLAGNTLYGTTESGGSSGNGTVFAVNTNGTGFTTLYSFTPIVASTGANTDGAEPTAGLVLSDNTLYGTTSGGGTSGEGVVFAVNIDGSGFTNLHSLNQTTDGGDPFAGVILSGNTLYGTAHGGGAKDNGTVFSLSTNGGDFKVLFSFTSGASEGSEPGAALTISGQTLFGTGRFDGSHGDGTVFSLNTNGGSYSALHDFSGGTDGANPSAYAFPGVTLSGNTLYGMAQNGGKGGYGTIFSILGVSVSLPSPPKTEDFAITAEASPAHGGQVTGTGTFVGGTNVTVKVTGTNDCYFFTGWTVDGKTVTNGAAYTFVVTSKETVVANFSQPEYVIQTSSSPPYGGKVTGGGTNVCGSTVTLTATAKAGFAFNHWDYGDETAGFKSPLKFPATNDVFVTAYFMDVQPPTVAITSPATGLKTSSANITVSGTAHDNVEVTNVYYKVNAGPWTSAQETASGWATWSAPVTLSSGANVVAVYAVDSSGNTNKPVSVTITYTAPPPPPGFAPLSLSGYVATAAEQAGTGTNEISFGTSTFAQLPLDTNDSVAVGNYTYTPTGLNSADLVFIDIAPPSKAGKSNSVSLIFTSTTTASASNSDGTMATVRLSEPEAFAPASLSGTTIQISQEGGPVFTNVFADGTFAGTDSLGASAGTYTFTPYSPFAGMIAETFIDPADVTSFILVGFTEANAGYYAESYINGTGAAPAKALGTFTVVRSTPPDDIAPASLDGMTMTIEPKGGATYTASFGPATHGTTSFGNTFADIGVANYTYTRTNSTEAILISTFINPPAVAGVSGPVYLKFTAADKATFISSVDTGTMTFAPAQNTAPLSLEGKTFNGTLASGKKGSFTFGDGTFTSITTSGTSPASSGDYTYVAYGPAVGLATVTYTDLADLGLTEYLQLVFTTPTSGIFYTTHILDSVTETEPGTFTSKETP